MFEHDLTPDTRRDKRPYEIYAETKADTRCFRVDWKYFV